MEGIGLDIGGGGVFTIIYMHSFQFQYFVNLSEKT